MVGAADSLASLAKIPSSTIEEIREAAASIPSLCELKPKVSNMDEQIESLEREFESMVRPERFTIGILDLDHALVGGLERGEMLTIGGETSSGKSVLLLMAALEAIQADRSCAVFSLEMTPASVLKRIACNYTGTELKKFLRIARLRTKGRGGKALDSTR